MYPCYRITVVDGKEKRTLIRKRPRCFECGKVLDDDWEVESYGPDGPTHAICSKCANPELTEEEEKEIDRSQWAPEDDTKWREAALTLYDGTNMKLLPYKKGGAA